MTATTRKPPRTDAERAATYGWLLAEINDHADDDGLATAETRMVAIRELLDRHGIHPGQVDADGQPVQPPHDPGCRQCDATAQPGDGGRAAYERELARLRDDGEATAKESGERS